MKIKKIETFMIAGIFLFACSRRLFFYEQTSKQNELNIAVSSIFGTILSCDKEVKHQNPYFYDANLFSSFLYTVPFLLFIISLPAKQ